MRIHRMISVYSERVGPESCSRVPTLMSYCIIKLTLSHSLIFNDLLKNNFKDRTNVRPVTIPCTCKSYDSLNFHMRYLNKKLAKNLKTWGLKFAVRSNSCYLPWREIFARIYLTFQLQIAPVPREVGNQDQSCHCCQRWSSSRKTRSSLIRRTRCKGRVSKG